MTTRSGVRTRVLIADDQALVRRGFRLILEIEPDLEVVGEAADGQQAVSGARDLAADIVLMDVRMPGVDGIEATRELMSDGRCQAKVIMLTTFDMDDYVYDALQAGASGFLLKDVEPEVLVAGIQSVHAGEVVAGPDGDPSDDPDVLGSPTHRRSTAETCVSGPSPNANVRRSSSSRAA